MVEATVEGTNSRKLTVEEITAHATTFMVAGYETTANALSYVSYLLALNPHVQEKLQEEIDKFYEENEVRWCACVYFVVFSRGYHAHRVWVVSNSAQQQKT